MLIGDKNDVKYNSGLENETKDKPNKATIARALNELKKEMDNEEGQEDILIEEKQEETEIEDFSSDASMAEEQSKGLMARRNA